MFAIDVEYLLGRAVATDANQRDRAEWPPHPTRLFSALVDALADVAYDSPSDPALHAKCEAALRWLEALPPPSIRASTGGDVSFRSVVRHFVPINDEMVGHKGRIRATPLVEQRARQERFFPAVVPVDPVVSFAWTDIEPEEGQLAALVDLAARVPYLGHSSSAVRVACRRASESGATLVPDALGTKVLRVPGPGRLDRLVSVHVLRKASTVSQPPRGREVRYGQPEPQFARGPHAGALVVATHGAAFGLEEAAFVVQRLRLALLSHLGNASDVLSGHDQNGAPATVPHVAFAPMANVGHEHADGSVKGVAIIVPRRIEESDFIRLESAASRMRSVSFGQRGEITTRLVNADAPLRSLQFERYCRPSRAWASVTPVVFGVHPKPRKGLSEADALARDVAQLGLPPPSEIYIQDVSSIRGAPRSRDFHRGLVKSARGRFTRHVQLRFDELVCGPILLGAARHMGFGLLLPEPT